MVSFGQDKQNIDWRTQSKVLLFKLLRRLLEKYFVFKPFCLIFTYQLLNKMESHRITTNRLELTPDVNLFIQHLQAQMSDYSELENCSVTWEYFNNELEYE
jgi:hypothetical protein